MGPRIQAPALNYKANSHIRDIAWAPSNIKFSAFTKSDSRALAVVTEGVLLVFEIIFCKDKTMIKEAIVASTIDVNSLIKSNKGTIPANICSSISHAKWH